MRKSGSGGASAVLLAAHCETAPDGVEMRVTQAKRVSPTPLGGERYCFRGRGGQASPAVHVIFGPRMKFS